MPPADIVQAERPLPTTRSRGLPITQANASGHGNATTTRRRPRGKARQPSLYSRLLPLVGENGSKGCDLKDDVKARATA